MGTSTSSSLLPPVVKILLISNVAIFVMQFYLGFGNDLIVHAALWPVDLSDSYSSMQQRPQFQLYQLVTYAFLHGSLLHIMLNMYALWLFGSRMENEWGSRKFTIYYFVCVIGAGLVQLLVTALSGNYYPTVGASGGVFGLLLAFGMFFPNEVLMLIFPPIALKAKWFVLIYAAIELWAGVSGSQSGVAHFAHLGGMLFGLLLIIFWHKNRSRSR